MLLLLCLTLAVCMWCHEAPINNTQYAGLLHAHLTDPLERKMSLRQGLVSQELSIVCMRLNEMTVKPKCFLSSRAWIYVLFRMWHVGLQEIFFPHLLNQKYFLVHTGSINKFSLYVVCFVAFKTAPGSSYYAIRMSTRWKFQGYGTLLCVSEFRASNSSPVTLLMPAAGSFAVLVSYEVVRSWQQSPSIMCTNLFKHFQQHYIMQNTNMVTTVLLKCPQA